MKPSDPLLQQLVERCSTQWPMLVGCPRQNVWAPEQPWRFTRGNALLAALGTKITISWPFGVFDVYVAKPDHDPSWVVLMFRGGEWRPWWEDDARLLGALVLLYSHLDPKQIAILIENRGDLTARYISIPEVDEARRLVADALVGWPGNPPPRIARDTPRAQAVCPRCPVLAQCEASDLETGATGDWANL